MRQPILAALLSFATVSSLAAAPRLVVQDAPETYPYYCRFSPDATHLGYITGTWQHLLVILDMKGGHVVYQGHHPEEITDFNFTVDNKALAFVTHAGLFWLDLDSGKVSPLAQGSFTGVAVDPAGDRVAVLGFLADPPLRFRGSPQSLAVLERKTRKWEHVVPTAINTGGGVRATTLIFEGEAVRVSGTGGDPSPMLPALFPVHARLDLKTGQAVITTGPISVRGRTVSPKDKLVFPLVPKDTPENVKYVFTEKFEGPKIFHEANEKARKLTEAPTFRKDLETFQVSERGSLRFEPLMNRFRDGELEVALILQVEKRDPLKKKARAKEVSVAVLKIDRAGGINLGKTEKYTGGRLGLKDLHHTHSWEEDYGIRALNEDRFLFQPDITTKRLRRYYFFDDGTLVLDGGFLAYYRVGEKKAAWTHSDTGTWHGVLASADEKVIAVPGAVGAGRAVLFERQTGKVLGKIPPFGSAAFGLAHALSPDARQHALIHEDELYLFDTATGKQTEKVSLKDKVRHARVFAYTGGWLIAGYEHGSTSHHVYPFHPKTGWGKPLPIYEVQHVQEVPDTKGSRVIIQDTWGRCALVDPESSTLLARWVAGHGGSSSTPAFNTLLPGGVVLRGLGMRGEFDLLDAEDGKQIVHFHAVPAGEGQIGYITTTPDGYWDATPGAERHLLLLEDGQARPDAERDARRAPGKIRERIAQVWK